jgi:hypothetical protein
MPSNNILGLVSIKKTLAVDTVFKSRSKFILADKIRFLYLYCFLKNKTSQGFIFSKILKKGRV